MKKSSRSNYCRTIYRHVQTNSWFTKNVDYENVKNRRIKNYRVLHQELGNINELLIPQECPAYQYPLLISDHGEK